MALGANALHRYDSGPSKNTTLAKWTTEARARGLFYVIQGTAIEAQAEYDPTGDPFLLAIAHDDEPDLNRWDASTADQRQWLVPDGKMKGMTRPEILAERYARWKSKWPTVPVRVNFSGKDMTNGYYADGAQHTPYMRQADGWGWDWYAKNTASYHAIGLNGFTARKLDLWAIAIGKPRAVTDAYFECSNQRINSVGRGPTPNEIQTTVWHLLAYGVKGVWAFPQRIGKPFDYNAMTVEQSAAVRDAFAVIARYENLIANGTRKLEVAPLFAWNPDKGTYTLPSVEVVTWTLGNETLRVGIDVTGETAPSVTYIGPTPSTLPTTQPLPTTAPSPTPDLAARVERLEQRQREQDERWDALRRAVGATTQPGGN